VDDLTALSRGSRLNESRRGEYRRRLESIKADVEKLALVAPRKDKVGAIARGLDGRLKDLS
jgi:hypothetical protein